MLGELRRTFRPEFLNRVDDIIVFHKLNKEQIQSIAGLMLSNLSKRLEKLEIGITYTPALVQHIADAGFDKVYGARPLRRAIQTQVEDALSEEMLEGRIRGGDHVICDFADEQVTFRKEDGEAKEQPKPEPVEEEKKDDLPPSENSDKA